MSDASKRSEDSFLETKRSKANVSDTIFLERAGGGKADWVSGLLHGKLGLWQVRFLHGLLGCILLGSAALKLLSGVDPSSGLYRILQSGLGVAMVVAFEVLVGAFLLYPNLRKLSHVAAIVLFACLSVSASWMVLSGVSDCGCFGRIEVSPKLTLGFDVVMLVVLLLSARAVPGSFLQESRSFLPVARGGFAAFVIFGLFIMGYSWLTNTTPDSLRGRIVGKSVTTEADWVSLGKVKQGELTAFTVTLQNHSDQQIHVIGGSDDCSVRCSSTFPIAIAPNSSTRIDMAGMARGTDGSLNLQYTFFVNTG